MSLSPPSHPRWPQKKFSRESSSEVRKILGCLKCKYENCIFIQEHLFGIRIACMEEVPEWVYAFYKCKPVIQCITAPFTLWVSAKRSTKFCSSHLQGQSWSIKKLTVRDLQIMMPIWKLNYDNNNENTKPAQTLKPYGRGLNTCSCAGIPVWSRTEVCRGI